MTTTLPHRLRRGALSLAALTATIALAACSSTSSTTNAAGSAEGVTDTFPITIEHAYGSTTIESAPTRVATTGWTNEDVVLALGVVPVGMPKIVDGDTDGDGLQPWVKSKLEELGATGDNEPALYDETDGIDAEAIANTEPDLIIGAQSGLTEEDYTTLSKIAPTVPYTNLAWGAQWRDLTTTIAKSLGRSAQGEQLITDTEARIAEASAAHPELAGKSAAFVWVDPTNLSTVSVYTSIDSRPAYLQDLGLSEAQSVADLSTDTDSFYVTLSSEQIDKLADVDVLVTYGDDNTIAALQADPLLSKLPAVANGAIAVIPMDSLLYSAASPSVLSIDAQVDNYAQLLGDAAAKVK